MRRLIFMIMVSLQLFCYAGGNQVRYFIRQAHWGDKKAMTDLYKKSQNYYKDRLLDSRLCAKQIVGSQLWFSLEEGFSFVVELISGDGNGKIIAFLIKHRPLAKSYHHVLDQGLCAIDPDFRKEMLLTQLYKYLQTYVEENCPDILRIEGSCHAMAYENIAMFERCDFVLECVKERCFRLSDGNLIDSLIFAWWNKNFDKRL